MISKIKPYRDEAYKAFIRSKPCGICYKHPPSEVHHVRRGYWGAGCSVKPHDFVCVPRCLYCHKPENEYNVEREIISLLMEYIMI